MTVFGLHGCISFFFFNDTATTEIYTLSLHDALPISRDVTRHGEGAEGARALGVHAAQASSDRCDRSEEHTSELQSHLNLVCRLLLEKKKNTSQSSQRPRLARGRDRSGTASRR